MAGIKISQLDSVPGGTVASIDQLPVARGDSTYRISAGQFVVDATNVGVGSGQFYSDKTSGSGTTLLFRTLSAEEGLSVRTSGNTMVISASGQNPTKTAFTGTGVRTTWPINDAKSINANNYRVTIDGVVQEPLADYTINGSNIVFSDAPPLSGNVVVVSNNLVRAFDTIPSDGSVTTNKLALSAVTTTTINNGAVTTEKINTGAVTNSKISYDGGSFCFRNKIINGDMRIDQRYAGTAATIAANTVPYVVDRFFIFSGTNASTAQRVSTSNANIPFALRVTTGSNVTQINIGQRLESNNIYDLIGQTVTLSFYASSPTITDLGLYIYTPNSVDNFSATTSFIINNNAFKISNTLTRYTYTFVMPAAAVNGLGIEVYASVLPSYYPVGTNFQITGVQLEAGPTATPFEYRPIGTELDLCQRYFETNYPPGVAVGTSNTGLGGVWSSLVNANGTFLVHPSMSFIVPKRKIPVMTGYNPQNQNVYAGAFWSDAAAADGQILFYNTGHQSTLVKASTTMTAGYYHHLRYTADAEL